MQTIFGSLHPYVLSDESDIEPSQNGMFGDIQVLHCIDLLMII